MRLRVQNSNSTSEMMPAMRLLTFWNWCATQKPSIEMLSWRWYETSVPHHRRPLAGEILSGWVQVPVLFLSSVHCYSFADFFVVCPFVFVSSCSYRHHQRLRIPTCYYSYWSPFHFPCGCFLWSHPCSDKHYRSPYPHPLFSPCPCCSVPSSCPTSSRW